MTQTLAAEIQPFGIRTFIIQPGAFTTNMQNALVFPKKPCSPCYENTELGATLRFFADPNSPHRSANSADKGARAIFEVVTDSGLAKGKHQLIKTAYVRAPISSDCADRTIQHIESLQNGRDVYKDIWESTKHDDGQLH